MRHIEFATGLFSRSDQLVKTLYQKLRQKTLLYFLSIERFVYMASESTRVHSVGTIISVPLSFS